MCFVKYPSADNVKTRLAENTGAKYAGALYYHMTRDVLETLKKINAQTTVFCEPKKYLYDFKKYFGESFESFNYIKQIGTDLGHKMHNAFEYANNKYRKIIVIASDIPQITPKIINGSFKALDTYDCVIGPCYDGGYYLLGFNREKYTQEVFKNISWSSEKVLKQTINRLKKQKLTFKKMPKLTDIDDIKSMYFFYAHNKNKNLHTVKYIKRNLPNSGKTFKGVRK